MISLFCFIFITGAMPTRGATTIPDTSEDENLSDDDDHIIPKPIEHVYIPESEVDSSYSDEDEHERQQGKSRNCFKNFHT